MVLDVAVHAAKLRLEVMPPQPVNTAQPPVGTTSHLGGRCSNTALDCKQCGATAEARSPETPGDRRDCADFLHVLSSACAAACRGHLQKPAWWAWMCRCTGRSNFGIWVPRELPVLRRVLLIMSARRQRVAMFHAVWLCMCRLSGQCVVRHMMLQHSQ